MKNLYDYFCPECGNEYTFPDNGNIKECNDATRCVSGGKPMSDVFPSILPGEEFVDDTYSEAELERKEYSELQSIGADHPSESVHGRMSQDDLIDGLEGLERV